MQQSVLVYSSKIQPCKAKVIQILQKNHDLDLTQHPLDYEVQALIHGPTSLQYLWIIAHDMLLCIFI